MYEVEVKVQADHASVRERLLALDATPDRAVRQADTYYDAPNRSFADTDEAVRIRRESEISFPATVAGADPDDRAEGDDDAGMPVSWITYKGPRIDDESKTREEHETTVGDADRMDAILRSIGFATVATVRKEREVYTLAGFDVALDAVEGLGEFVEVDAEATGSDVHARLADARDLLDRLGLDPAVGIQTSYLEFLLGEDE